MLKRFEVLFVDLTDRKKQILKVVVEDYIRTAEPVGSKAIASEMGGSVIKNLVCLPFQTVLLLLLMTALRPALKKMRLVE